MNRVALKLSSALCSALLCASVASAQIPAYTEAGPIPSALTSAKTFFVSNGGTVSQFFPDTFTGDANRAYSQFYAALKATGKYDLVGDPSQADLVLYLRLVARPCRSISYNCTGVPDPQPVFYLTIYDRKTHYVLWTITQPVDGAILLKNHDHNFDAALAVVVREFERVTGKTPVTP
ncbi:MAG TPA: hypothetical protein VGR47_05615 [Terracidiphilus sp.]|nr:hypothetical protein [Terracidiphilus sp.]